MWAANLKCWDLPGRDRVISLPKHTKPACSPDQLPCEGELDAHLLVVLLIIALVELLGVVPLALAVGHSGSLDNVDQWRPDSVSGAHLIIQLQECTPARQRVQAMTVSCLETNGHKR